VVLWPLFSSFEGGATEEPASSRKVYNRLLGLAWSASVGTGERATPARPSRNETKLNQHPRFDTVSTPGVRVKFIHVQAARAEREHAQDSNRAQKNGSPNNVQNRRARALALSLLADVSCQTCLCCSGRRAVRLVLGWPVRLCGSLSVFGVLLARVLLPCSVNEETSKQYTIG